MLLVSNSIRQGGFMTHSNAADFYRDYLAKAVKTEHTLAQFIPEGSPYEMLSALMQWDMAGSDDEVKSADEDLFV
jgi:hypothetical protein